MEIVTKENYWIEILNDESRYGLIVTEDSDFNSRSDANWNVLENTLIKEHDVKVIREWEKNLKIISDESLDINTRKANILYRLSNKEYIPFNILNKAMDAIVGEGNYILTFNKDFTNLTITFGLSVSYEQIVNVQTLLSRVLLSNIVTEFNEVPIGYTRVEYLESTGKQRINTGRNATDQTCVEIEYADTNISGWTPLVCTLSGYNSQGYAVLATGSVGITNGPRFDYGNHPLALGGMDIRRGRHIVRKEGPRNFIDGVEVRSNNSMPTSTWGELGLLYFSAMAAYTQCKLYGYKKWELGEPMQQHFVPALDPTGTPCMFDIMSRKTFYNSGSGDFLYAGAEQNIQTLDLDLDAKSYAKLTEHGVRRLYHVPEGCTMTKDEYAVANGFKELVEPPAPLEGYWTPVWHETETQLICEWIETETT